MAQSVLQSALRCLSRLCVGGESPLQCGLAGGDRKDKELVPINQKISCATHYHFDHRAAYEYMQQSDVVTPRVIKRMVERMPASPNIRPVTFSLIIARLVKPSLVKGFSVRDVQWVMTLGPSPHVEEWYLPSPARRNHCC